MKLVVNAISAKQGGIVTYTQNMIRWMRTNRVDAIFAVPESFEAEGSNVIHLPASNYPPMARLVWEQTIWPAIVARHRCDLLFSSANFGLFAAPVPQVLLVREGGLFDKFYLTNFGPIQGAGTAVMRSWRRRLMFASARWADQVIAPSYAMRDLLIEWQPALARKIQICPYGTRSELFAPRPAARLWRADGCLRLIYVSVYYPHKNPGVICNAVRLLNEENFRAHATITMDLPEVKRVKGGTLDGLLMAQAAAMGEVALGRYPYDELPELYAGHDVFVFPSVSESFGHPMAEAMSMGIPIIAADTPINREICGDGALYFSPFSPRGLAARLLELDANPLLRQHLVEAGLRRVGALYRWDDHMSRLMSIFEHVVAKRRKTSKGAY